MDSESQERIYLALFRVWQEAHKSQILSQIPNQDSFIQEIQELIQILKTQIRESEQSPLSLIYQKTLSNLRYMAQDLLRIRKSKILKFTQRHQKIEENTLFPFEQAYYRQLYTAFRGYSTSKKGFVQSIENNGFNGHNSYQPASPPTPSHAEITAEPTPPNFTDDPSGEPRNEFSAPSAPSPLPTHSTSPTPSIPSAPSTPSSSSLDQSNSADHQGPTSSKVTYSLFRTIKSNDALVGEDFQIYGPLQAEDLIFLPDRNAHILLEEKIVREINPTK